MYVSLLPVSGASLSSIEPVVCEQLTPLSNHHHKYITLGEILVLAGYCLDSVWSVFKSMLTGFAVLSFLKTITALLGKSRCAASLNFY